MREPSSYEPSATPCKHISSSMGSSGSGSAHRTAALRRLVAVQAKGRVTPMHEKIAVRMAESDAAVAAAAAAAVGAAAAVNDNNDDEPKQQNC